MNTAFESLPLESDLGPDPEPLGVRAGRRLDRLASERSYAARDGVRPHVCPLARAAGHTAVCSGAHCPWYEVPGTVRACAVEQWAPRVAHDARVARWFVARGEEILAGRGVRCGFPARGLWLKPDVVATSRRSTSPRQEWRREDTP